MSLARLFNPREEDLLEHYPNPREYAADGWVHGVGLALAAIGGAALIAIAWSKGGPVTSLAPALYALSLITMLSASAAYNLSRPNRARFLLRTLDEAAIFVMIAGSYTPFLVSAFSGWAETLSISAIWMIAAAGVAGKLFLHSLSERFWCGVYIGFGWLAVVMMAPLINVLPWPIVALLAVGGIVYTAGVAIFLRPSVPFRRAVWHGFVTAGAALHYVAVLAVVAMH